MADPRFFDRAGPYTLETIAALSGARPVQAADPAQLFYDVAPLETAGADDISFLDNRKYAAALAECRAGAVFLAEAMVNRAPPGVALTGVSSPGPGSKSWKHVYYPRSRPRS